LRDQRNRGDDSDHEKRPTDGAALIEIQSVAEQQREARAGRRPRPDDQSEFRKGQSYLFHGDPFFLVDSRIAALTASRHAQQRNGEYRRRLHFFLRESALWKRRACRARTFVHRELDHLSEIQRAGRRAAIPEGRC
jgi:hypothetical protein